MVKRTQTIHWKESTNCLSVFDHLVGLALEELISNFTGKLTKRDAILFKSKTRKKWERPKLQKCSLLYIFLQNYLKSMWTSFTFLFMYFFDYDHYIWPVDFTRFESLPLFHTISNHSSFTIPLFMTRNANFRVKPCNLSQENDENQRTF